MTKRIRKLKQCEKPMQKNTRDGRLAVKKIWWKTGDFSEIVEAILFNLKRF